MTPLQYTTEREQFVQATHRLDQAGVLSHSGHGNISIRLPEPGLLLLTSVSQGSLRVEPTANNQAKGIHWAKDYEI